VVDTLYKGVRCKQGDSNAMGGMLMANGAAKSFTHAATYVYMSLLSMFVCVCAV
jgi:hypothetical protein